MVWQTEWLSARLSPLHPQFVPPPPPPGLSNEKSRGNIIDRTESSLDLLELVRDIFPAPVYESATDSGSSTDDSVGGMGSDTNSLRTDSADSMVLHDSNQQL